MDQAAIDTVRRHHPARRLLRADHGAEADRYHDLVEDTFEPNLRPEQERISYSTVCRAVDRV